MKTQQPGAHMHTEYVVQSQLLEVKLIVLQNQLHTGIKDKLQER